MKSIYKCKKCKVEILEHDEPVIFQEAEYRLQRRRPGLRCGLLLQGPKGPFNGQEWR